MLKPISQDVILFTRFQSRLENFSHAPWFKICQILMNMFFKYNKIYTSNFEFFRTIYPPWKHHPGRCCWSLLKYHKISIWLIQRVKWPSYGPIIKNILDNIVGAYNVLRRVRVRVLKAVATRAEQNVVPILVLEMIFHRQRLTFQF